MTIASLPSHTMIRYDTRHSDQQRLLLIRCLKKILPQFMEREGRCFRELFCHKLVFDQQGARIKDCIELFKQVQERFSHLGSDFRNDYFRKVIQKIKNLQICGICSVYGICKRELRDFFIRRIKGSASGQALHKLIERQTYIVQRTPLDHCFAICADKHPWNLKQYQKMLDDLMRNFSQLLEEEKKAFLDHYAYVKYDFSNDSVLYRVSHAMQEALQKAQQAHRQRLFKAVWENDIQRVETTIEDKKYLTYKDHNGLTALHLACLRRHKEIVQLLIQKGASCRERSRGGATPLQVAAERGFFDGVELLLDHESGYSQEEKEAASQGALRQGHKTLSRYIFWSPLKRAKFSLEKALQATGAIESDEEAKELVKEINFYQRRINLLSLPTEKRGRLLE